MWTGWQTLLLCGSNYLSESLQGCNSALTLKEREGGELARIGTQHQVAQQVLSGSAPIAHL